MDAIADISLLFSLGAALVAGVFQSFSDFVMRGLIQAEPSSGMDAMQQINRTVLRSLFLMTFMLLAPASIAFAVYALIHVGGAASAFVAAASAVYVILVFSVTMFGNVPMNAKLAAQEVASAYGQSYWRRYGRGWSRLNHIRFIGSLGAAGLYMAAARILLHGAA